MTNVPKRIFPEKIRLSANFIPLSACCCLTSGQGSRRAWQETGHSGSKLSWSQLIRPETSLARILESTLRPLCFNRLQYCQIFLKSFKLFRPMVRGHIISQNWKMSGHRSKICRSLEDSAVQWVFTTLLSIIRLLLEKLTYCSLSKLNDS